MFKKVNESEVISDQGFKVKCGRNRLSYIEGKRALSVDVEHLVNPYKLMVYTETIMKWHPPFANEKITLEKKNQIIANIEEALLFLGVTYELQR